MGPERATPSIRRFAFLAASLLLALSSAASATVLPRTTLRDLTAGAARVVRARCVSAEAGSATVAGGRLVVTTYSFEVTDLLKGDAGSRLIFRQIGTSAGGPHDLGARVGLPVYHPGSEYVLFLLPESRSGLTSPAGAGQGAFAVRDERVIPLRGGVVAGAAGGRRSAASDETRPVADLSYEELRNAVRDEIGR